MANIFIDIETIPATEPTEADIRSCSLCKKEESIQKDFEDNYSELLEKALKKKGTSIYDSKIICLGYAFNDEPTEAITGKEKYILQTFENKISARHDKDGGSPEGNTLFGYNSKEFDFPIIYLKACLYNLPKLKSMMYFSTKEDVMRMATFNIYKKYVSMDNICKFFGIEGKGDMDGSMVYPAYKEGRIEEIAKYCRDDVHKTRKLEKLLRP